MKADPAPKPRRKPLSQRVDEDTLRAYVAEGLTDAEIAEQLGTSPRNVRIALGDHGITRERQPPRGEPRPPGLLVRCVSLEQRKLVHDAREAAGRDDTSQWLLDLALRGPELARTARREGPRKAAGREAIAAVLELLAGPEDRGGDSTSGE